MSITTGQFIKLYKIMQNHIRQFVSLFFTGNRGHFWNTDEHLRWTFIAKKLTTKSC